MFKPSPGGFTGRVIESQHAYTGKPREFSGPHLFLQASTPEQVQAVVNATDEFEVLLRSGNQVSRTDKGLPNIAGGLVLDLSEFRQITWDNNQVTVGVGVTARALANALAEKNLVLPLSENPDKSIISDILSEQPSVMVKTLGRLDDYVTHVALITAHDDSGSEPTLVDVQDVPDWVQNIRENKAVATSLTFRAVSADSLWSLEATFFRPDSEGYLTLAEQLLSDSKELPEVDMSLRSYYMPVDQIAIGTISMAGRGEKSRADAKQIIEKRTAGLYAGLPDEEREIAMQVHERRGAQVYPAIVDTGQKPSQDPVLITNRIFERFSTGPAVENFLIANESKILDKAMGYRDARLDTRIVALPGDEAVLAGFRYEFDSAEPQSGPEVSGEPVTKVSAHTGASSVASALAQLYLLFPPTVGHPELPRFMGQVYGEGLEGYETAIVQYSNKYSDEQPQRPYLLCEVNQASEIRNDETDEIDEIRDISIILDLIKESRKGDGSSLDLVVRTGGHQYSGLSTGGGNTVVVLMNGFTDIKQRADPDTPGNYLLTVGAGELVGDLYRKLRRRKLVLPGGQCPKVAMGGHVQTGGYGFFTRSAGLLLDYVHSFQIVLADKTVKTVTRPSAATSEDPVNDELFRAVMGGSPGSFGVIVYYTFSLSLDSALPTATRYKGARIYTSDKARQMMNHMRAWSEGVAAEMGGPGEPIPGGRDFIITFSSAAQRLKFPLIRTHINVVENGESERSSENKLQDPASTNNSMKLPWPFPAYQCMPGSDVYCFGATERSGQKMSHLIDDAISRPPATSKDGRELDLPYQKRLHCSSKPLSENFVTKFCDQMDEIVSGLGGYWKEVNLIAQVGVLGGKHSDASAAAVSAIEHRDAVVGFTFDIFHSPNSVARGRAIELQNEIAGWVAEHFNDTQERRILWGTFGSTSLADETVRKAYYPDDGRFERLVKIKQKVDSDDLFRNEFSIPPKFEA